MTKYTLIAVPCMDFIPYQFAESLLNLQKPEGTKVCFKSGSLIYDARNLISLTAIENNYDYVLWLDSDVTVPYNALTTLLNHASPDREMISALYVKRRLPSKPVIYNVLDEPSLNDQNILTANVSEWMDYPRDTLTPVRGCGFGCVLTSVPLLKRVWDKFGPAFAPFPWAGEDLSFCHRVNLLYASDPEPHKSIWADTSIKCGHIGNFIYTEQLLNRGDTIGKNESC